MYEFILMKRMDQSTGQKWVKTVNQVLTPLTSTLYSKI